METIVVWEDGAAVEKPAGFIAPYLEVERVSSVALRQVAGARLRVEQDAWEVTGLERSTGFAGAFLVNTDLVYVFFTEPQVNTFYEVIPSEGVIKHPEFVEVSRPDLAELNFIVQRVQ